MLIIPSLTLIAWKLRSNWTLFYPICGMFCCLKVRWENLVTFCEVRLSWHKVSILSPQDVVPWETSKMRMPIHRVRASPHAPVHMGPAARVETQGRLGRPYGPSLMGASCASDISIAAGAALGARRTARRAPATWGEA